MQYTKLTSLSVFIACVTLIMVACPEPKPESSSTSSSTPSFNVTFNLNDGTGDMSSIKVPKGTAATKPQNNPIKDKHTFGGWHTDEALTMPFFFVTEMITKNLTLYAGWNPPGHYTVRFNTNGGDAIPKDHIKQTVALGGIATVPPPPPLKNRR